MQLKSIQDINVKGKKVLLRADLNVPLNNGKVTDTTRIDGVKPTVDYLLKNGAQVILCSHLGRPKGQKSPEFSLKQIVSTLSEVLKTEVTFVEDCIDIEIPDSKVVLLENTRFHEGEKENNREFAKKLASLADIHVNDAFGLAHRAHASNTGVADHIESYAGLLMMKEVDALSPLIDKDKVKRPLTLIIGGAKIDTKIGILKNFINVADNILIGGALANTFLLAEGFDIGESMAQEDKIEIAQDILLTAEKEEVNIQIPTDVIVADEITETAIAVDIPIEDAELEMKILDIGRNSMELYVETIMNSETIVMNGPMGLYEFSQFEAGTRVILEAIAESNATSVIGGGDSIDALNNFGISHDKFTHISTGGGAMIEFLEGKVLPGIATLIKN